MLGDEGCAVHADHAQHTLLDENELDGRPLPIELSKNYSSVLEVLHRMHDPREHLYVLVVLEDTNIGDLLTADQRDIAVVVTLGRMTEKALDGPVDQDPQHVARTRGSVRRVVANAGVDSRPLVLARRNDGCAMLHISRNTRNTFVTSSSGRARSTSM